MAKYRKCSEVFCKNIARIRPGKKHARCRECREFAARLLELHQDGPRPSEEQLAAEREARLFHRVVLSQ